MSKAEWNPKNEILNEDRFQNCFNLEYFDFEFVQISEFLFQEGI